MSGVNLFMAMFTETICDPANKVSDPVEAVSLVTKLLHLDTVVVVSTFTDRTQHIINEPANKLPA